MPKSHAPCPGELKRRLVELVRAGRNPEELAAKFEPSAQAIRNWVRQADRDDGRREDGLTTAEREERRRLRRENKTLREEREFLRKAAAWFARETGSIPPMLRLDQRAVRGEKGFAHPPGHGSRRRETAVSLASRG